MTNITLRLPTSNELRAIRQSTIAEEFEGRKATKQELADCSRFFQHFYLAAFDEVRSSHNGTTRHLTTITLTLRYEPHLVQTYTWNDEGQLVCHAAEQNGVV